MATSRPLPERIIALPRSVLKSQDLKIFELPNPSNISSKKPVKVFIQDGAAYQVKTKAFSQGCEYHRARDSASDKYYYTAQSEPIKSAILTNSEQPQDGWLRSSGSYEFSTKYDLCFSLCGALFLKFQCKNENEYQQIDPSATTMMQEKRYLMTRDFLENLVEKHHANWSLVPLDLLENCLEKLGESIEEAGDIYHKVTPAKVTKWLIGKVEKITQSFPPSIPLPRHLPDDLLEHAKVVYACNLLISLIPQPAYQNLIQYDGEDLNISKSFQQFTNHQVQTAARQKEQELLIDAAMKVGISTANGASGKTPAKKVTKVVKTKKVNAGKGAIDGFFKKRRARM
ncbi:LADA_0E07470g1_1 [Lachancea dasiensis]|uniref:Ribonuclease H2 subunit B n=1 Tax=Lachancea dasiensis TaxID=1072105 RepID=A0A1G4JCV5_9SACH|nr:LADA_0E07470g1_1 [Lachancea dasiensis]